MTAENTRRLSRLEHWSLASVSQMCSCANTTSYESWVHTYTLGCWLLFLFYLLSCSIYCRHCFFVIQRYTKGEFNRGQRLLIRIMVRVHITPWLSAWRTSQNFNFGSSYRSQTHSNYENCGVSCMAPSHWLPDMCYRCWSIVDVNRNLGGGAVVWILLEGENASSGWGLPGYHRKVCSCTFLVG